MKVLLSSTGDERPSFYSYSTATRTYECSQTSLANAVHNFGIFAARQLGAGLLIHRNGRLLAVILAGGDESILNTLPFKRCECPVGTRESCSNGTSQGGRNVTLPRASMDLLIVRLVRSTPHQRDNTTV